MAEDSQKSSSRITNGPSPQVERHLIKCLICLPTKLAILLIRGYQLIASPWIGNQCRFTPTCSHYAIGVYREFGFLKGTWLSLKRIVKCNPWVEGGINDIPKKSCDFDKRNKLKKKSFKKSN
jgi:putative membrane protein insertion efficiency factor